MRHPEPGSRESNVQVADRYDNFIGGKWVAPVEGRYFENPSPVSGRPFTEIARSTAADVELALDAAHAAKESWAHTSSTERSNMLATLGGPAAAEALAGQVEAPAEAGGAVEEPADEADVEDTEVVDEAVAADESGDEAEVTDEADAADDAEEDTEVTDEADDEVTDEAEDADADDDAEDRQPAHR